MANRTVFLHEGASSAHKLLKDIEGHPWEKELKNATHLGWIGGAMNPERTNWAPFNQYGISRVYIVPDNDSHGREAIRKIVMSMPEEAIVLTLNFGDSWPIGFDLGDGFPKQMFKKGIYIGPLFKDCLSPATWATKVEKSGKRGRPSYSCTPGFLRTWQYVSKTQEAVCLEVPHLILPPGKFNDALSHYSHTNATWKLLVSDQAQRANSIVYRPDKKSERMVITDRGPCVNIYQHPTIDPIFNADIGIFEEYLEMMIPRKDELFELKRWIATLVAKPEIRILWAVLLSSNIHGLGKSTLGSTVLQPLVGAWNVSLVNEADLMSDFNVWQAYRRLAIVEEIYTGHGWAMYNKLKVAITELEITVNIKHRSQHKCDNWAHVFACSNSGIPIRMDANDRRWFYPDMSEIREWERSDYEKFRDWLAEDGLRKILGWALDWGDYVLPGEEAPMTERKLKLIYDSIPDERVSVLALVERLSRLSTPGAVSLMDLKRAGARGAGKTRTRIVDSVFINDISNAEVMKKGLVRWHHKYTPSWSRNKGKSTWILCNEQASEMDEEGARDLSERAREWLMRM